MKGKKLGSLFLISILALAGIGVSYAGLTDSIFVYGQAKTAVVEFTELEYSGTFVSKIYGQEVNEYGSEIDVWQGMVDDFVPPSPETGEVVSWAKTRDPTGDDPATIPGTDNEYEIFVDCHNLIPQIEYVADLHFKIHSIPVKFEDISYEILSENDWDWITDLMNGVYPTGRFEATLRVVRDVGGVDTEIEVLPGMQIHPGEQLIARFYITIPQNNMFQDLEGSFAAHLGIIQWTDPCNPDDDLTPKDIVVPEYMQVRLRSPDPGDYNGEGFTIFDCEFIDVGSGSFSPPIENGNHARCWCVDENTTMGNATETLDVVTFKSNEFDILTVWPGHDENTPDGIGGITAWDCVNYIINHDDGYSIDSIQNAIWYYVNGGHYPGDYSGSIDLIDMVNDSYDTGVFDDWITDFPNTDPGYNMVAVMLVEEDDIVDGVIPSDHDYQLTIIEVDP